MTTQRNTAIVTGAASGIGRAMTLGLLGAGIDVAAVDREAPWLDELKGAVAASRLSGQLQTLQSDLSDLLIYQP
jgi:NAD(P)-dependent dehydrogenase (short-subunit alcohol dehydrogenase family)